MEFRERDDGGGLPAEVDHLVRFGRFRAGSRLHTHMATVLDNDVADPTARLRSRMTTAGSWTSSSRRGSSSSTPRWEAIARCCSLSTLKRGRDPRAAQAVGLCPCLTPLALGGHPDCAAAPPPRRLTVEATAR